MQEAFGTILFVVIALALLGGVASLVRLGRSYERIGRSVLAPPEPVAPAAEPPLEAEVRALVERRNARRVRDGEPPLDVTAEVERELRALRSNSGPDTG